MRPALERLREVTAPSDEQVMPFHEQKGVEESGFQSDKKPWGSDTTEDCLNAYNSSTTSPPLLEDKVLAPEVELRSRTQKKKQKHPKNVFCECGVAESFEEAFQGRSSANSPSLARSNSCYCFVSTTLGIDFLNQEESMTFGNGDSGTRVRIEELRHESLGLRREPWWAFEISSVNLPVHGHEIVVLKRQKPGEKHVEDDAAGPEIRLGSVVSFFFFDDPTRPTMPGLGMSVADGLRKKGLA
ncbi:hypothetical protein TB2_026696 [Malus domestica]